MEKQFVEFEALVPANFTGRMIQFWMKDDNITREEALNYIDDSFKEFAKKVTNRVRRFKPDLGYTNKEFDGAYCFDVEDNNWVIPVEVLESV